LLKLNFNGPYSGSRHQFLVYGNYRLTIPSNDEYSVPQLRMMLKEVKEIVGKEINLEIWSRL
jgi:hypothetical protein